MRRGRRFALVVAASCVAGLAPPAFADTVPSPQPTGHDRGGQGGQVEVEVTRPGRHGQQKHVDGASSGGSGSPSGGQGADSGDASDANGGAQLSPEAKQLIAECQRQHPGRTCSAKWRWVGHVGGSPSVDAVPNAGGPPVQQVRSAVLAGSARDALTIPFPVVRSAPPNGKTLVQLPSFYWVTNGRARTATATLDGVTATARAVPEITTVTTDEGTVQCAGTGLPWSEGMGRENVPVGACAPVFHQVHDSTTVQVAVTWRITWSGSDGDGGTLAPFEATTDVPLRVLQREAVGVGNR